MNLKNKILFILISCLVLTFLFSKVTFADNDYETGVILPECIEQGNCSLCDLLKGFANIADFLISIVGSVALILFLYGGYVWLSSAGNQERVKRGRNIIISTFIGILLVMGAWQIVNFTISAFVSSSPTVISFNLFTNQPWYQYCDESLPCVNKNNGEFCGNGENLNYFQCKDGLCISACSYKAPAQPEPPAVPTQPAAQCYPSNYPCNDPQTKIGNPGQYCPNEGICCQDLVVGTLSL